MTTLDESTFNFQLRLESTRSIHPELPDNGGYARWTATLDAYEGTPDHAIELGSAWVVLFRDARWNTRFYDRMDEVDTDMEQIASAVYDGSGAAAEELFESLGAEGGDLIIIDRVGIHPEYRGQHFSHMLVDAVAQALSPEAVIVLLPMPAGPQEPANVAGLQKHWSRAGFLEFRNGVYARSAVPKPNLSDAALDPLGAQRTSRNVTALPAENDSNVVLLSGDEDFLSTEDGLGLRKPPSVDQ
jgi:GNAT superfamily N-acetyltransferase